MRRRGRRREFDDDGDEDDEDVQVGKEEAEETGPQGEAMREVMLFRSERKRNKGRQQGDSDEEGEQEGGEGEDEDEEQDVIFERRADGTKKITGVDGERDYRNDTLEKLELEMGNKLEPFNLRQEMEEGHYDEAGHYVERNFSSTRDAWLEEMDELHAHVVGGARTKFVKPLSLNDGGEEDGDGKRQPPTPAALAQMVMSLRDFLVDEKETVTQALKRLADERKQRKKASKAQAAAEGAGAKALRHGDALFARPVARPVDRGDEDDFDRVTSLADELLSLGHHSVYSFRKKDLSEILLAKKRTAKIWSYRLQASPDAEVHGPFSGNDMLGWQQQGYFSQPGVEISIRIGPQKGVFRPAAEVDFDKELEALN